MSTKDIREVNKMTTKRLDLYIGTLNNENTKKSYRTDVECMMDFVGKNEEDITLADLLAWKVDMQERGNSTATMARRIGSVKRYFDFLVDIDVIVKDPSKKLKAPKVVNKVETTLTADDVHKMLACTNSKRDKAIIATLASTGMRISELINIKMDDIDGDDIHIIGKGSKRRVVHINEKTREYIHDYLVNRKFDSDKLFASNSDTPMLPNNINRTLKRLANEAGLDKNVHNHSFRHLWATSMLDHGVPIDRIQVCMGHSDISVTRRYAETRNKREVIRETMNIEVF